MREHPMREDPRDAYLRRVAVDLDRRLPGWLVIYGPYHRRLTAFGLCTPTAKVVDADDPGVLLDLIQDAQRTAYLAAHGIRQLPGGGP